LNKSYLLEFKWQLILSLLLRFHSQTIIRGFGVLGSQADLRDFDVKDYMKSDFKKIYYKMYQGALLYSSDKQGKIYNFNESRA